MQVADVGSFRDSLKEKLTQIQPTPTVIKSLNELQAKVARKADRTYEVRPCLSVCVYIYTGAVTIRSRALLIFRDTLPRLPKSLEAKAKSRV